jgi:hypothetical protein
MRTQNNSPRLRFRIVADDGHHLGWIHRGTKEEAQETLLIMFPRGGAHLKFREEDQ